jgi:acetylornithine deacetylase/succinyl-diaminopimelate desuccinylase-like protein
VSTASLRDEVTTLLQELIRLDTVNPPGNETLAAEHLRRYLEAAGVACELHARVPERANLVARIAGSGGAPSLCLLSHTDTVFADPADWRHGPWSGDLVDGEVWGRGALDMKGQVAASAVAIASLAREGFRPRGDLLFVAAADEEVGEGYGLSWLCAEHPEAVRCDYAVNEGAGDRLELGGRVFYLCAAAEKMTAPFRLRVRGRSGHASMPGIADNALVKAAKLVERLGGYRPPPRLQPEVTAFLGAVGAGAPPAGDALAAARELHPLVADLVEPLLGLTLSPTMIHASEKRNVIPALCDVVVDCRLPPGETPESVEPTIRALLGDADYELEWLEAQGGTRSPLETPLWEAVASFVEQLEPGAAAAPMIVPGFTDSHWLREAFGTVAYGFFPARALDPEVAARLIHSTDERVPVADLELGLAFLRHAAQTICA